MTAQVTINGDVVAFDDSANIADAVARALSKPDGTSNNRGIAVAVNREVVPRHEWATRLLRAGDQIEIITAVQGG